jgi:hypothetical protein
MDMKPPITAAHLAAALVSFHALRGEPDPHSAAVDSIREQALEDLRRRRAGRPGGANELLAMGGSLRTPVGNVGALSAPIGNIINVD